MQRIISSIARPKLCSPFKLKYIINFLIVLCSEQINFACCQVLFDVGFQCVCVFVCSFPSFSGILSRSEMGMVFTNVEWTKCVNNTEKAKSPGIKCMSMYTVYSDELLWFSKMPKNKRVCYGCLCCCSSSNSNVLILCSGAALYVDVDVFEFYCI